MILLAFVLSMWGGPSEILDSSESHFRLRTSFRVSATAKTAYEALVDDVDKWWHPDHTYSGDPEKLSIEAKAGGCFCEELEDGGSVRHLEVVYVEPRKLIRMTGGLGPLQELPVAGMMAITLDEDELGTEITLEYKVSGHYEEGMDSLAAAVNEVLSIQVSRLGTYIEGK